MRSLLFVVVILLVAGCGGMNTPSIAPNPSIASATDGVNPTALASLLPAASPTVECAADIPLPGGCDAATAAILDAVNQFGLAVKSIRVQPMSWPCGRPFLDFGTSFPPACPVALGPPTAWVEFLDSDKVAALSLTPSGNQIVVTVDAFGIPPTPGVAPA